MKEFNKQPKPKKQPTRGDLAQAWKTIRDQFEIIELQADAISRQDHLPEIEGEADRRLAELKKSRGKRRGPPNRYLN